MTIAPLLALLVHSTPLPSGFVAAEVIRYHGYTGSHGVIAFAIRDVEKTKRFYENFELVGIDERGTLFLRKSGRLYRVADNSGEPLELSSPLLKSPNLLYVTERGKLWQLEAKKLTRLRQDNGEFKRELERDLPLPTGWSTSDLVGSDNGNCVVNFQSNTVEDKSAAWNSSTSGFKKVSDATAVSWLNDSSFIETDGVKFELKSIFTGYRALALPPAHDTVDSSKGWILSYDHEELPWKLKFQNPSTGESSTLVVPKYLPIGSVDLAVFQ